jgi:hypothetical protein
MDITKNSSVNRPKSRYSQGGTTEVLKNRIGYWDRRVFPTDSTDIVITLDNQYHRKPWLVAYDVYKDVELMWFILQYNNILDVDTEFVTGTVLRLPTTYRLRIGLLSRGT